MLITAPSCTTAQKIESRRGGKHNSMSRNRFRLILGAGLAFLVSLSTAATAQSVRYGEYTLPAIASGEELSRQPELWIMEVHFRPLRQILVDLTDPVTGKKSPRYVWYLPYRAINRKLANRAVANAPVNELDAPVIPPQFIPVFTIMTTDDPEPYKVYPDQVLPEAIAAINQREKTSYKSTVSVIRDLPPATAPGAPDQVVIQGVATWVGLDPKADFYTVFLTGFSNGFVKGTGPGGAEVIQWKTIRMKYWRPGDELYQREPEIQLDLDDRKQQLRAEQPKKANAREVQLKTRKEDPPTWIYR